MIAIVGATGVLGGELTRQLLASGEPVVAITRDASRARDLASLGAEVRVADLVDHASLAPAIRGVDAVIAAAHGLLGRGRNASGSVDDAGHRALIDAAREQRVSHFVYTSVVGASPSHPVSFWRTKYATERYLEASGLRHTILRPTAFMETHAHMLLGKSVLEGKPAVVFGSGAQPLNFVAASDVAAIAVMAMRESDGGSRIIEIGGPDNLTRNDVVALYGRVSGRQARARHVSTGALRVLSAVMRPFHEGLSGVMAASISFETIDQSFDPAETLRRFPIRLTTLEDFVRAQATRHASREAGPAAVHR